MPRVKEEMSGARSGRLLARARALSDEEQAYRREESSILRSNCVRRGAARARFPAALGHRINAAAPSTADVGQLIAGSRRPATDRPEDACRSRGDEPAAFARLARLRRARPAPVKRPAAARKGRPPKARAAASRARNSGLRDQARPLLRSS